MRACLLVSILFVLIATPPPAVLAQQRITFKTKLTEKTYPA